MSVQESKVIARQSAPGVMQKEKGMPKKQLLALFLCALAPFVIGSGALPLLPVYASRLGAPPIVTGYYLAFCYLALTVGALFGGWLSDRFGHRRRWLIVAGVLGVPATWALGQVTGIGSLTAMTACVWFLGGTGMSLTNILAGLFAGPSERGRVFGVLALASGSGEIIGGLMTGPVVDRWGYAPMFALLSLFFVLWPAAALFLQDKQATPSRSGDVDVTGRGARLGKNFYLLFTASLLVATAAFVSNLGRSLSMNAQEFSATAISSTVAVAALAALPLPLLLGPLSDRLGRKRFLAIGYLCSVVGLVLLSQASLLWHFWVAVACVSLSAKVRSTVGQAFTTDLVSSASLGRGLSLYGATSWVGAVIGFASTGHAVQRLGLVSTLVGSALLPLLALSLLLLVQSASDVASARQA